MTGTVQKVQTRASPRGRFGTHMLVHVENTFFRVRIGPSSFLADQPVSFSAGDEAEIIGARSGNGNAIIARQVVKDGRLIILPNEQGIPPIDGSPVLDFRQRD